MSLLFAVTTPAASSDIVKTRCTTETLRLVGTPSTPAASAWDVRRLISCGDESSGNALWHLDRLDAVDGTLDGQFHRTRANALVYVLDSGVEINHDEFAEGNVIAGLDVPREQKQKPRCTSSANEALHPCFDPKLVSPTYVIYSHGTGVASLIAGRHVGVAPGASIVSVLSFGVNSQENRNWLLVLDAVIRTAWDPATPQVRTAVINMSSQLSDTATAKNDLPRSDVERKIRDMIGGVDRNGKPDPEGMRFLFVAAAGNAEEPAKAGDPRGQCGPDFEVRLFPASLGNSLRGLITVGGSTRDNHVWSGSCRGDAVEILAPAEEVMPATNSGNDQYRLSLSSGTSFSAPIVAGAAALILSQSPDLTPAEVEDRLEATASYVIAPPPGSAQGRHVVTTAPAPPPPRRRAAHH